MPLPLHERIETMVWAFSTEFHRIELRQVASEVKALEKKANDYDDLTEGLKRVFPSLDLTRPHVVGDVLSLTVRALQQMGKLQQEEIKTLTEELILLKAEKLT